jgi:hypothetical protein
MVVRITKVDNYKEINKNILSFIDKIPKNPFKDENQNISNTDWNLPQSFKREYLDYFYKIITPYMDKIAIILDSKKWNINNGWFQQYTKSEGHEWHTHAKTNFTNVYFVELPSTSLGTEILNYQKLDLKEGDLLTLPGHVYHRSPKNFTNERKTIISFNSDFFDYKGI